MNLNICKNIRLLGLGLALAAATSCVYQDMEPCPVEVQFVYDYNMEFADAFPTRVKSLTFFVYDGDGQLVGTQSAEAEAGFGNAYRMPLDLQPGTYTLAAWATDDDAAAGEAFRLDGQTAALSLRTDGSGTTELRMPSLWNGTVQEFEVSGTAPALGTVRLTQDVKRFRILLQKADGTDISPDDYGLAINAANHSFGSDNTLQPCSPLDYTPYLAEKAAVDNESGEEVNALVYELNTLRLMAGQEARFTVRDNRKGENLFDVNLLRYLEMMRMDEYSSMPLQEYLDREDDYRVILFLGRDGHLLSIQINMWTLVLNGDVSL